MNRPKRTTDLESEKLGWCPQCRRLNLDGQCVFCGEVKESKVMVSVVRKRLIVLREDGRVFA